MGGPGTRRGTWLLAALIALATAQPASATLYLAASSPAPGQIALFAIGDANDTDAVLFERAEGADVRLGPMPVTPPSESAPAVGEYPGRVAWRCDRRTRTFVLTYRTPQGAPAESLFTIRTPSCRDRLGLAAPLRVQPGRRVAVTIRDRWKAGGIAAQICRRAPGAARAACRTLRIPAGRSVARLAFTARATGRWAVEARTPFQRARAVVAVGVTPRRSDAERLPGVLTTGDSMMQTLDAVLGDRLAGRARVDGDVRIASGITKAFPVDWLRLPAVQLRRSRPRATVVLLGANDAGPFGSVNCCAEAWIAEYARRARRIMRAYTADGRHVYWLTMPTPDGAARAAAVAAVNAAIPRAASGLPRARVIDLAAVLSPGGRYAESIDHRGGRVRVRQSDGVHLTVAGARIAAALITTELERDNIL